jgi:penicillin-binding protein 1C
MKTILSPNSKYQLNSQKKLFLFLFFLVGFVFLHFWTKPDFKLQGTIKIWDRNKILLWQTAGEIGRKIPITLDQVPQDLIKATLASEDPSFWQNPGFDPKGLLRAFYLNLKKGRVVAGGSTITQQLVRSVVISPGKRPPQTILRKIREILMAVRLTLNSSKEEILGAYLNQMYYGHLAYGVEAAAQVYFGKSVSQISLAEAAFLAGLVASPDGYNPFSFPEKARERRNQILDLMVKYDLVDQGRADRAKDEKLQFKSNRFEIKAPHFVEYVIDQVKKMSLETGGGVNVLTTLDYHLYQLASEIARQKVEKLRDKHHLNNSALVLLDNQSREILVMLGGVDYFDDEIAGQVNMALAKRQPGSALKPFTYATAFIKGETPASLIFDVPQLYETAKGEGFTPHNCDGRYRGLVLAREALASSYNLPAVEMLSRVGIEAFLETTRHLGMTTLTQIDRYDLAITLGGGEVKLLELTNAYASLARKGKFAPPVSIKKITDDQGQVLFEEKPEEEKSVLGENSQQVAYLITDILSDQKARIPGFGEKNALNLSRPAAVKTGTTTDWHDNWTIGYTPGYTLGVWVGNADNQPMREITGVTGAAPIWHDFFEEFLKDKLLINFRQPDGLVKIKICKLDGFLPDGLCDPKEEIFIKESEPKAVSQLHQKIKVDRRSGLLAGPGCSPYFIEEKIMVDYPAEVFSWAIKNGLELIPDQYSPLCPKELPGKDNHPWLEIISPLTGVVFESTPLVLSEETVVFEVRFSSDVVAVEWFLNDQLLARVKKPPFSYDWRPILGSHDLFAYGFEKGGGKTRSNDVKFEVAEFYGD